MLLPNAKENQPEQNSHLFTLRMWLEDLGNGQLDWRGKVQHVNSGEVIYFRNWKTLEVFIQGLLQLKKVDDVQTKDEK